VRVANRPQAGGRVMNVRYIVRVRGVLGPLLRTLLADVRCEAIPCQTTIAGPLSDKDLQQLLTSLDKSGAELVHLECSRG
jgi:hypothetical protein